MYSLAGEGHPVTADLTLGIAIVDLDVVGRGDFALDVLVHCRAVRRGIEYGGRANICIHFAAAARAIVRAARAHREAFLRVIFIVWRDEASLRISYLCGE